jgi:hypothetical protein
MCMIIVRVCVRVRVCNCCFYLHGFDIYSLYVRNEISPTF